MNDLIKLVPNLRFPAFIQDGEWKEQKFGSLFAFLPNNTLSRADLKEGKGDVYNVHYGDVLIKLNSYTDIQQDQLPAIKTVDDIEKYRKACLQDGDIVIADTAEDETVGKCTEIVNVHNTLVVSGLHTIPCRPQIKFAQAYLGYYMNSNAFHNKLLPIMQGVKVTSISKSALQNIDLTFPESLEEQQKIAECLSSIDSYISSINEQVEHLKAHKTSLLQKLFPQRGQTVPEYRFPEFEKDSVWEKREFKEIVKVNSGRDYKHLSSGNIPVYGTGGYMLSVDGKLSDKDAVGIGRKGTIDRPQYLKAPFWTVDTLFFLTNCDGYDIEFIYFLSQIIQWRKYGEQTGVPSLSKNSIEKLEVVVPTNIKEQKKIARALFSLDERVKLLEKKMAVLESHKNGLMQQLFPQI